MEAVPGRAKPYVPGTPLPPAVTSAAAERGLGALVDVRREGVVIRMVVAGILLVLLGLVFNGVFSSMARLPAGRLGLIRPTAIFGVVLSFLMLGGGAFFAVRGILGAWRGHYLFAGGMVHRFLTTTRVATWAEIDRFAPIRNRFGEAADGRVLGYRVEVGGRKVAAVPILLTDGRDSFLDQAIARLGVRDESGAAAAASGSATAQPSDPTMTPSAVAVPSVAAQASAEPPPANVAPAALPAGHRRTAGRRAGEERARRGVRGPLDPLRHRHDGHLVLDDVRVRRRRLLPLLGRGRLRRLPDRPQPHPAEQAQGLKPS